MTEENIIKGRVVQDTESELSAAEVKEDEEVRKEEAK
jgi:hypothetical protein